MITATDIVRDDEELKEELKDNSFRLAKVVELFKNQTAKIQFDGEEEPSEKEYSYLSSYIPQIGDRVILGSISNTYVIFGAIRFNVEPDIEEEIDRYLFDEKKVTVKKGIDIKGEANIDRAIIATIESENVNSSVITGENITIEEEVKCGQVKCGQVVSEGDIEGKKITGSSISSSGSLSGDSITSSTSISGNSLNVSGTAKGNRGDFNSTSAGSLTCSQMSTTGNITGTGFNQFSRVTVTGEFKHSGGTIGFLGKSPVGPRTIPQASGDLNSVTNTVNQLRQALRDFGLLR